MTNNNVSTPLDFRQIETSDISAETDPGVFLGLPSARMKLKRSANLWIKNLEPEKNPLHMIIVEEDITELWTGIIGLFIPATKNSTTAISYEENLDLELKRIEEIYFLIEPEKVRSFIRKNTGLASVLVSAYESLHRFFQPDPQIELMVTVDPDEGFEELFGYIKTSFSVDEALDRLDSFDENWFLDQLPKIGGKLNFNLVFE